MITASGELQWHLIRLPIPKRKPGIAKRPKLLPSKLHEKNENPPDELEKNEKLKR
jgi:hypothetical protein